MHFAGRGMAPPFCCFSCFLSHLLSQHTHKPLILLDLRTLIIVSASIFPLKSTFKKFSNLLQSPKNIRFSEPFCNVSRKPFSDRPLYARPTSKMLRIELGYQQHNEQNFNQGKKCLLDRWNVFLSSLCYNSLGIY